MRIKKIFALCLIVSACFLIFTNLLLAAEESKYNLKTSSDVKDILKEHTGKSVYVRMESGEEVFGIVAKVGDHLVQISEITGREFYDALIRIDRINIVIFKVRGN